MRSDRPSITAFCIAFGVVVLGGDEYGRQRLPPGNIVIVQKELLAAVIATRYAGRGYELSLSWVADLWVFICNPFFSKLVRWLLQTNVWVWGGNRKLGREIRVLETIGYRKTFMENCVREALEVSSYSSNNNNCCQQVLILGGGLDTLAMRLSAYYPSVQFWELDHPATSHVKQQALTGMIKRQQMTKQENLHLVPIDLATTSLKSFFCSDNCVNDDACFGYNSQAPTVVVVEGLLMYLTESQVVALLQDIAVVVGPQSLLVFDFVEAEEEVEENVDHKDDSNGEIYHNNQPSMAIFGPIVTWSLQKLLHEPWLWGIASKNLSNFVERRLTNWECVRVGSDNSGDQVTKAAGAVCLAKLQKKNMRVR